ncbi:Gamma-aminobutyric acid type B receptor subunit 1 [Chamberlinius hualienensis]
MHLSSATCKLNRIINVVVISVLSTATLFPLALCKDSNNHHHRSRHFGNSDEVSPLKTKDLTIAGIFPMKGSSGWIGGPGCLPAAEMALRDVNKRDDILPGYRLNVQWNDSECEPGLGASVMYDLLYNPPQKLMLLCGCSVVCTTVGEAAKMWNLVVLSFGSSSPALSNRKRFPTFFRTHPSATVHNPTRIKLFERYKWQRIAILQQAEEVFISTVEDLENRCKEAKNPIEIVTRQSFLTKPADAVRNLRRQDARIIVGLFYVGAARQVMCEAFKNQLYGKQYVWFLIGWYEDNWYRVPDEDITCSPEEMKIAVEGHITTEALMLNQDNRTTISGMTAEGFIRKLDNELAKQGYNTSKPEGYQEAPLAYDAIWAAALALNKTMHQPVSSTILETFTYDNKHIADEIYAAMNSTQFLGVSGNVAFSEKGDRIALTQVEQMIDGNYVKLGYYDTHTDDLTWFNRERWIGGKVPRDRTLKVITLRKVSLSLFISMSLICVIGIIIAFLLLAFNFYQRERKCIEFSHPACNNIMLCGIVLCFISAILLGIDGRFVSDTQFPLVCQSRSWILTFGFTLAYGSMFTKVWRVHRLTTKGKSNMKGKTLVRDNWRMYVMLGVMLVIDITILFIWQLTDPLGREIEKFPVEKPLDTDEDMEIEPQLEHCASQNNNVWLGTMYGYKGLLLIFGIFLAYETRSVTIKQINDSRLVGMSIYNVVVLCMITAPVTMVISSQQDASFAFVSLAIIFCCFLSMALIFMPKVIDLVRHPQERAESRHVTDTCPSKEEEEKHQKLLTENDELKQLIAEQEEKIRLLHQRLLEKGSSNAKKEISQSDCGVEVSDSHQKPLTTHSTSNVNSGNNQSVKTDCQLLEVDGTASTGKNNVIVNDLNSDSAIGAGTSIARSSRTSPSDFELSESYL